MFEKLKNTNAIIFDMRGYPRGATDAVAARLAGKRDLPVARFDWPIAMTPSGLLDGTSHSAFNSHISVMQNTEKWRYRGKTVMLIDEHQHQRNRGVRSGIPTG